MPAHVVTTFDCSTPKVVGMSYLTYSNVLSAAGGAVALIPSVAAMVAFYGRNKSLESSNLVHSASFKQSIRKNVKLTKALLLIAVLDVLFVSVPNLLQMLITYKLIDVPNLNNYSLQIICSRGSLNLFIYLTTNQDFRIAFFKTLSIKKSCSEISPTTKLNGRITLSK